MAAARSQEMRQRALFLRFASRLRAAAARVYQQLGHREREAVYQRALAAELESMKYTCVCEHPVPVVYAASDGRLTTVAHERADIAVTQPDEFGKAGLIVLEIKRGAGPSVAGLVKEGLEQGRRYGVHLKREGRTVIGVGSVAFNKSGHKFSSPAVLSEWWADLPSK